MELRVKGVVMSELSDYIAKRVSEEKQPDTPGATDRGDDKPGDHISDFPMKIRTKGSKVQQDQGDGSPDIRLPADEAKKMSHQDIIRAITGEPPPTGKPRETVEGEVEVAGTTALPEAVEFLKSKGFSDAEIGAIIAYSEGGFDGVAQDAVDRYDFERDLDWPGIYTDVDTFRKQVKLVGSYNAFEESAMESLISIVGPKVQYRLGREGSVVVYVKPVTKELARKIRKVTKDEGPDEVDLKGDELRLWWD